MKGRVFESTCIGALVCIPSIFLGALLLAIGNGVHQGWLAAIGAVVMVGSLAGVLLAVVGVVVMDLLGW